MTEGWMVGRLEGWIDGVMDYWMTSCCAFLRWTG